jgi:Ankyrin repeats (3 copies)
MNIPKDVYEYLTNFADDKTILNMLSTNKEFSDEIFFERVLRRKYPFLMAFKKDQTWKKLYIRMAYYIAKLEEKFGIPYIPTEGYDPEDFYKEYKDKKNIFDRGMAWAAGGGNMEIVKLMIEKGATDFNTAMENAAYGGQMEIVKFMISKGSTDFDWAMIFGAEGGKMEIVKFMIEKGATDFDSTMSSAANGGHMEIVKFMIEKGATDFDGAMKIAAGGGHMEIVKFMIEKGATNFNSGMFHGAEGGHMEIVNYLKQFV